MAPPRTIQELIKYEKGVAEGFRAHDGATLIGRGCGAVDNPDMTGRSSAIAAVWNNAVKLPLRVSKQPFNK